jgi:uncharacterized protein (DUF427 family)
MAIWSPEMAAAVEPFLESNLLSGSIPFRSLETKGFHASRRLLHDWPKRDPKRNKAMTEPGGTTTRTVKIPGPDHPVTIERNPRRVVVKVAGLVVADSRDALTLREASYPAVQYIPRKDVDMTLLQRTSHATYCPYKGDCAYFSIPVGGERSINAVWTYERPYPAAEAIKECLAFYPDRIDAMDEISSN